MRFAIAAIMGLLLAVAATADGYSPEEASYLRKRIELKRLADNEHEARLARQLRLAEATTLIAQGPISPERHVIGSVLSIVPGFGVGQAVQGRYFAKGLIFSAGELIGVTMALTGDRSHGLGLRMGPVSTIGVIAFATFKVWEVIDAVLSPVHHNSDLRELEKRVATRWSLLPVGPAVPDGIPQPGPTAGATFSLWL